MNGIHIEILKTQK